MYNYHADIIWSINAMLLGMLIVTSVVIFACVLVKSHLSQMRRLALIGIKKNVYEMVLASGKASEAVCQPFISTITPQQFIDIATNRSIEAAFFNDSEQRLLKSCFVNPEEVARLAKIATRSTIKWRRIEAIICLGYTESREAVEILKKSLYSKDYDISYFSMVSLGLIKTVESARILIDFLKKDLSAGAKIISVLESFPKEISDDVIKLTEYHDPVVRTWAIRLLSKFAVDKDIFRIEKLTHDGSDEVRAAACDCLGDLGNKSAESVLLKCLEDESWSVRRQAIFAVGKVMGDAALPEVIKLINDSSWVVIDAVKDAMVDYIEAAIPYIERFLVGEDEIAKKYSVLALEKSGYMGKLFNDIFSGNDRDAAVRLLKGVMRSKSHAGLDAALNNLDPAVRAKVLELLVNQE
ncbi:MAG: HEAT repeat domain-containing protein [Candidatus Omnitrophica bacterium]|nr:HEAT repeat domain-containing protein [Candidatus Omnitrophota bacterium]